MKVVMIGSGNVATVLGRKILTAGHSIEQVFSKSEKHSADLAAILNSSHTNKILEINDGADLYIIAINDQNIAGMVQHLSLHDRLIVHTAGSASISVLKNTGGNFGVLYPLQSLRKETDHPVEIPILVDGNNAATREQLRAFAATWASAVIMATDEERMKLHVAAVIVSNFSNHLYALTEAYCKREGVAFSTLVPIILETANRLEEYSPATVQTGPAARGDVATVDKHLHLLTQHPGLRKIYLKMTESIIENNKPLADL